MTKSFIRIADHKPGLIVLFCFCISILNTDAQTQLEIQKNNTKTVKCRHSLPREEKDLYRQSIRNEKNFTQQRLDGTFNLPIQFHVVRRTDGTGGLTAEDIAVELAFANAIFDTLSVEFFQCLPVHFIDSDYYFNTEFDYEWEDSCLQDNAEYQIAEENNVPNVINIYYVNTDGWNWSSFPYFIEAFCKDWIIMNIGDTGNTTLLAHELGHYFNLLHTHQGYDDEYNEEDYEHITRVPANECFNCEDEGDFLCDTPADPNRWVNCEWDGLLEDGCSDLDFDPDPDNIMSYSDCEVTFTAGQMARMTVCILTTRSYLNCPYLSDCEPNWFLTNPQFSTYAYQATNTITSYAEINPPAVAVYDAEQTVKLMPGFHAKSGSVFNAFIEGCWGPYIFK